MSCPVCQKDSAARYRPFCSKRCADVDLGKWLGGQYAIPSSEPFDGHAPDEAPEGAHPEDGDPARATDRH